MRKRGRGFYPVIIVFKMINIEKLYVSQEKIIWPKVKIITILPTSFYMPGNLFHSNAVYIHIHFHSPVINNYNNCVALKRKLPFGFTNISPHQSTANSVYVTLQLCGII